MTTDLEHSTNCIPKNSIFERARARFIRKLVEKLGEISVD